MSEEATNMKSSTLPLHIKKLEGPEGLQVWKREMRQWLTAQRLMKWTRAESQYASVAPIIPAGTPLEDVEAITDAAEDKRAKWELGHELAVNIIQNRLGNNLLADLESETNAYVLWEAVLNENKPKGSGTLNDLYRQLLKLDLSQCKDASDYAARLKAVHIDIINISPHLSEAGDQLPYLSVSHWPGQNL